MSKNIIKNLAYSLDNKTVIGPKDYTVKEAVMENSAVFIARGALQDSKIELFTFSDNLEQIAHCAFMRSHIKDINIKNPVRLNDRAFEECIYLTNIDINTEVIPINCFYGCCKEYIKINLPATKKIQSHAFYNSKIASINMPIVEIIEDSAFANTTFLEKDIFLPKSVKLLGRNVFAGSNIKNLYLPKDIEFVHNSLFSLSYTVHVFEETYNNLKLEKETYFYKNIDIIDKEISIEKLFQNKTFKEINKNYLDKKEATSIYR